MNPEIENKFTYHEDQLHNYMRMQNISFDYNEKRKAIYETDYPPKEGQPAKYEAIRAKTKELAYLIDTECPNSREKSLAMTKLEEAVMWANAAIARN